MLRRKLILILGSVTAMLVVLAVAALWPLNQIFEELDHISNHASTVLEHSSRLNRGVGVVEVELYRLQSDRTHRLDQLIDALQEMDESAQQLGEHYVMHEPAISEVYERMVERLGVFQRHVTALATTPDPQLSRQHTVESLTAAAELRSDVLQIARYASAHVQEEQAEVTSRFRWLVIGIAIAFLLVINVSIMMMLRAAGMILKPVDQLVQASRELAIERFDHRVDLGHSDEFGELGEAYNRLAAQLQENEQKRVEVLQQVALTLNHELNNAMAVIQLQLKLIERRSNGGETSRPYLEQIQESLKRMARVVESLKHVRRIVLTDYAEGAKMIDLERSLAEDQEPETAATSVVSSDARSSDDSNRSIPP